MTERLICEKDDFDDKRRERDVTMCLIAPGRAGKICFQTCSGGNGNGSRTKGITVRTGTATPFNFLTSSFLLCFFEILQHNNNLTGLVKLLA
jgi:hypothetical protein